MIGTYDADHPLIQRPDTVLAWVKPGPVESDSEIDVVDQLHCRLRLEQRLNRKLQSKINRYNKLIPGRSRVWELNRIAMEFEVASEIIGETGSAAAIDGLLADALLIRRLEYDLVTLNDEKRAPKGGGNPKYDERQWPRGERP